MTRRTFRDLKSKSLSQNERDIVDSTHLEIINVRSKGAIGDGIVDDTATIQQAIDESPLGSIIEFPNGTYLVENLIFRGRRMYRGYGDEQGGDTLGRHGSRLKLKPGSTGNIFVSDRWYEGDQFLGRPMIIENMIFDGNKTLAPSGGHAIILANYRGAVEGCTFVNMAGDCIHMPDTFRNGTPYTLETVNTRIDRCRFRASCDGYSVYSGPQTGETTFSDGWMLNCLDRSVKSVTMYPSSGWLIQGNHPNNNTNGWKFFSGRGLIITDNYLDAISAVESRVSVEDVGERGTLIADNYGNVGSADVIFDVKGNTTEQSVAIITGNNFSDDPVVTGVRTRLNTGSGNTITVYLDNNAINFTERSIRKGGANGSDHIIRDAGNNSWNYLDAAPAAITNGRRYGGMWWRNTDFSANRNVFGWVNASEGNPGTNRAIPCFNGLINDGATWDAPSIAAGSTATTSFSVPGAAIDNAVIVFPPVDLEGLQHSAYVDSADSVTIVLNNNTAGAVDLASDFWNVIVIQR